MSSNGEYRFTNLKFEEAKAIIEMKGEAKEEVVQVFHNPELEKVVYSHLGLEKHDFLHKPEERLHIGQEAVKIKNLYIYCQHVVRVK